MPVTSFVDATDINSLINLKSEFVFLSTMFGKNWHK